jgi:hypothetical protein
MIFSLLEELKIPFSEKVVFCSIVHSGKVWVQTLPISRLASRILQYARPAEEKKKAVSWWNWKFFRRGWILRKSIFKNSNSKVLFECYKADESPFLLLYV